jgi:hypothetical protein
MAGFQIDEEIGAEEVFLSRVKYLYSEANSVVSGSETQLLIYTVPSGMKSTIYKCDSAGTNTSRFRVEINGTTCFKKYSYFTDFNIEFNFTGGGILLNAGDVLKVYTLHNRPSNGDYAATLFYLEE